MAVKQSVNVSRSGLLKNIQDKKAVEDREYEASVRKYESDLKDVGPKIVEKLKEFVTDAENGLATRWLNHTEQGYYNGRNYSKSNWTVGLPDAPQKPVKPDSYSKLIRLLELSTDETFKINTESDFYQYI